MLCFGHSKFNKSPPLTGTVEAHAEGATVPSVSNRHERGSDMHGVEACSESHIPFAWKAYPSTQYPKSCAGKTGPHITLLVDVPNLSWSIATALCSRPCSMSSSSVTVTCNGHVWPCRAIGSSRQGDRHSKDRSAHRRLKRGICPMTHVGILSKETQKPWPFFSVCWFADILSSLK